MILLLACANAPHDGATPLLSGDGFFDRPFPSDSRLLDGHPDMSEFPGHQSVDLVQKYLTTAYEMDGWGNNSPIYFRFAEPIDPALLPSADASLQPDSPVWLVDVDTASPTYGNRVPLQFEWVEGVTTYQPGNLLAVAPLWGFPLRGGTTYAVVLFPPLAAPGEMPALWSRQEAWRPLADLLLDRGVDLDTVAAATIFTTQDPTREMAVIADTIHHDIGLPATEPELTLVDSRGIYDIYQGHVTVPIWQEGERPYHDVGGGFVFDADGVPQIQAWERVRFSLSVPFGDPPTGGWPTVIYSHGTGGDDTTFYSSGDMWDEAQVAAAQGAAMIGISQPLHGDRSTPDTNVELDSFNYFNPDAGRCNFRQGALDQVFLATWLGTGPTFAGADGDVPINPDRLAFFGHSQGGLVGAIATPFMSEHLLGAGFSGTGGGLAQTIVLRKDPLDIAMVLASLLDFTEDEQVTTMHPVIGLVQGFSEVTDPLNYGPWWFAQDGGFGGRPVPIVMTEGLNDQATPSVATEALAAAARVPIVGEPATDPEALVLRDLEVHDLPTEADATAWTGAAITAGLGQYADQDHYAIYYDYDARQLYGSFLGSALDGEAVIK